MLQHENPNIEIINPHLWAVRFSLIPLIPQISFVHEEGTDALPMDELMKLPLQFSSDGRVILNKDHKCFEQCKKSMVSVMRLKSRQLKSSLISLMKCPKKTPVQVIYQAALEVELGRRNRAKNGGDT